MPSDDTIVTSVTIVENTVTATASLTSTAITVPKITLNVGEKGDKGDKGDRGDTAGNFIVTRLTGALNGVNKVFTAPSDIVSGTELVLINGLGQLPTTHYTIDGDEVTFDDAPEPGDYLQILYNTEE